MPLFEFACNDCGTRFEEIVARDASVSCPKCGGSGVRKLFSAFAVGRAGASSSRTTSCASAPAPT